MKNPRSTARKMEALALQGFKTYQVGTDFAVADPHDDKDGFYLFGSELSEVVDEAYKHLITNTE